MESNVIVIKDGSYISIRKTCCKYDVGIGQSLSLQQKEIQNVHNTLCIFFVNVKIGLI